MKTLLFTSVLLAVSDGLAAAADRPNFLQIIWDYEADGNVEHVDEHDLTPADVEFVL